MKSSVLFITAVGFVFGATMNLAKAEVISQQAESLTQQAVYEHLGSEGETYKEMDSDELIGQSLRGESQACQTSGYCQGYGYNIGNSQYEYFYGYHLSCEGRQDRTVTTRTYRRTNGSTYNDVSYGSWSFCRI